MNVTRIDEHRSRDVIATLEELLLRARRGHIRGLAFAIKLGARHHRLGFTGDYFVDPYETLGCVTRMEYKLNQIISGRDEEPETNTMPL